MARFLFPEDEAVIRDLCATIVAMSGHVLDEAHDGVEGRDRVLAMEYDAIVSDGQMPGMSGPTFLAEVWPVVDHRVPCALKSASATETLVEMGAPLGVRWFVQKPFEIRELADVCTQMLRTRVDWLIAGQPRVSMAPRPDGRWVELEALEAALYLAALASGGDPLGWERDGALVAPSPRAAVDCLAGTVRDWYTVLDPPDSPASGDGAARWPRLDADGAWPTVNEEVRLGDEQLRRETADTPEPLRTRIQLALCCARYGWRWQVDREVELVVAPPIEAHLDRDQLHCETGPALRYSDGWAVYALYGIRVPPHVVTNPERITLDEIRAEPHAEVRRVLRERFGEERYLDETGAVLIDADSVPVDALAPSGRSITRALIEDDEQRRFLVSSDGSTRRVYHMEVPRSCETCAAAYVALSGRPDVRTIVEA